jgi:hypothetical protein
MASSVFSQNGELRTILLLLQTSWPTTENLRIWPWVGSPSHSFGRLDRLDHTSPLIGNFPREVFAADLYQRLAEVAEPA